MSVLPLKPDSPQSKPLTIHLDQLLGTPVDRKNLVAVSFQAFRILIERLNAMYVPDNITPPLMPSLYIPLESTEALVAGPLDFEALIQQINYNEPPSLYLTERSLRMKLLRIERYIFPLEATDSLKDDEGVHVYYSATRNGEDIKNGWEYGRNIVAEYYPEAYQHLP